MRIVVLAALLGIGFSLLHFEEDVLFRMQELSLFLPTKLFYDTLAIYPGGTLSWMAAYCTQSFFHTSAGVVLLVSLWTCIWGLIIRNFRLRGPWEVVALAAPLALTACLVQTGYWIYYMKLPGHAFVPTLGVLISLLLLSVHRLLPSKYGVRLVWMAIVGIVGYPLMGAWSFLALGLMAMPEWKEAEDKKVMAKQVAIRTCLALALIIVVPQVMCRQFYEQTQPSQVYFAALPSFHFNSENYSQYHIPYYGMLLSLLLPGLFVLLPERVRMSCKPLAYALASGIVCLFAGLTYVSWYRDNNFHKEIAMTRCIEEGDWQGVLNISADITEADTIPPTRVMTTFKNLALFRLRRAADEMYHFPEGATRPNAPWPVRMTQVGGKMLYYHYGKENFCYRWCMEDGVEYGWNVDQLRMMTKCSILNHDWEVARKYINILKLTRYYRDWANKYEAYLYKEDKIKNDPEMEFITHLAVPQDRLDGDNTLVELFLMRAFANGRGADPIYEENTLLCAMQMKDIDLFWPRFAAYANRHGKEPSFHMPIHFQEAAYLFSMLEPQRQSVMWPSLTNEEALQKIPFDQSVKDTYANFMQWNSQYNGGVQQRVSAQFQPRIDAAKTSTLPEKEKQAKLDSLQAEYDSTFTAELAKVFKPAFGNTYYYAYYLVRNQKTN